ncbi:MAG TPA: tRNA (adenosine(37)-N6)-threonylcarbamoyltransferase complex dimerization subunit type 1 TsaB [Solirubrobacteraceae bacterium]|nr:tRNA (adenosine(37)-N6)-threonylcarbamoyltransferase complex dimerization subunit type 1 TsaB [Solirubrobacteraceae bacterium]
MNVLGFDTATPATAVALRLADGATSHARDDPSPGERPGHTTRLLALAHGLLAQAGLRWSDLELIAVGVGPGTFTGLRVGVASARGLAQSLDVELVGVSTPRVLAEPALRAAGGRAPVLAAIDARRGEAFLAAYAAAAPPDAARTGARRPDGAGVIRACELAAPRALAPQAFAAFLAGTDAGSDAGGEWLAVGDGATRFRPELQAAGVTVAPDDSPLHRVDAGVLCELAAAEAGGGEHAGRPPAVLPDYCRRPDAELALERARGAAESAAQPAGGVTESVTA